MILNGGKRVQVLTASVMRGPSQLGNRKVVMLMREKREVSDMSVGGCGRGQIMLQS